MSTTSAINSWAATAMALSGGIRQRPFKSALERGPDGKWNEIYEHLGAHFETRDIGSIFLTQETNPAAYFRTRIEAIGFAEGLLREALETGSVEQQDGWHIRIVRWKESGSVDIEARGPKLLGLNALLKITSENRSRIRNVQRSTGGRSRFVPVIEGAMSRPVNVMQIGGGPKDDGFSGLHTMYPGSHAPSYRDLYDPIVKCSGEEWWATRAFASLHRTSDLGIVDP